MKSAAGSGPDMMRSSAGQASEDFRVVGKRRFPPDPGILKAIGLSHGFESAIADLVDNSIDAGANRVLVRFVLHEGLVSNILVVDNGRGMDEEEIDSAMQLGRPKSPTEALGHFGVGLKSASFSQASLLTVLSREKGEPAQGRRMARETHGKGFECELLAESQVEIALDEGWPEFTTATGTVVRWDGLRTFPHSKDPAVTSAFIEEKQNTLRHHLGLIFHRLLDKKRISISIDVLDTDIGESGLVFNVDPINPFAYIQTGAREYPKTLNARFKERVIPLECHVWPGGSDSHFFKLAGAAVENYQGFYLYRFDRLLSPGGWGGVVQETKRRKLARVAVDIDEHLDAFTMSMEKTGVRMVADMVHAVETSEAEDGTTFHDYLAVAEETFRESNKRVRKRPSILPPGVGIPPRVKRTISRELTFIEGEESVEIRWAHLTHSYLVEVDREQRILWINNKYRRAILKGLRGGVNDVPLIKALLFLLYEDIFRGAAMGVKDKENLSMWGEILTAAAETELLEFDG
jgi:hypothetical protein